MSGHPSPTGSVSSRSPGALTTTERSRRGPRRCTETHPDSHRHRSRAQQIPKRDRSSRSCLLRVHDGLNELCALSWQGIECVGYGSQRRLLKRPTYPDDSENESARDHKSEGQPYRDGCNGHRLTLQNDSNRHTEDSESQHNHHCEPKRDHLYVYRRRYGSHDRDTSCNPPPPFGRNCGLDAAYSQTFD